MSTRPSRLAPSCAIGTILAAATLAAAIPACFLNPYRSLTAVDDRVAAPRAEECGGCHVEIYREFRASEHAASWDDAAFISATSERSLPECLGCHAPISVYPFGEPTLRSLYHEDGVTCIACHFDGNVLAGPAPSSALVDPHPIAEERPLYRSSELCGKCHEGTLREWSAAPATNRKTCQECHMKPVLRTLTQATDAFSTALVSFENVFAGRAHTFEVDAIAGIENGFDVTLASAVAAGDAVSITVRVTSKVPHLVPTGDFGIRRVTVVLEALDSGAGVVGRSSSELFKANGNALVEDVPREFTCTAPRTARTVNVALRARRRAGDDVIVHARSLALP